MSKVGEKTNKGIRKSAIWYLTVVDCSEIPCHRLTTSNFHKARFKGKYQNIKSVEYLNVNSPVYCFKEHKTGKAVFNNTLTYQCNLTEVIVPNCVDAGEMIQAAKSAALIGTLQAAYTNFGYLRQVWEQVTDAEALLGVSLTGIAQMTPMQEAALPTAAAAALEVNRTIAHRIGINPAARVTTVKPSGSTSAVMDSDSGVHASHAPYYIRGISIDKDNPLGVYLLSQFPLGLPHSNQVVVQHVSNPDTLFLRVPVRRASNCYRRDDLGVVALSRIQRIYENWILPGHVSGQNTHNVSATVSYLEENVGEMVDWLCANRNSYQGLSFLAFDGGTYVQAPFTDCTKEEHDELLRQLEGINLDFANLNWAQSADTRKTEFACAGGMCEIT